MTDPKTHLSDGTQLQGGKYRITHFLSSGGFGCTYEALHVMLRKRVALKEFFVSDFCNRNAETAWVSVGTESKRELVEKLHRKFIDEAQSMAEMSHKHIVRVTDVFEENGTAYYVMDFIEGQSLADMVKHRGPLPESEAVDYIRQVADALDYVHSLNRLHLDIKPGNIMVDKRGRAILIDFGASKQYDEANGENTSTLTGMTRGYAPPEQMSKQLTQFTPSTDIYSLGATLYKLITGKNPPDVNQLYAKGCLPSLPESVSKQTRQAVTQAMQLAQDKRPQTISQFISLLDNNDDTPILAEPVVVEEGEIPIIVDAVAIGAQEKPKKPEQRRKHHDRIIAGAVALLAVLSALAWYACSSGKVKGWYLSHLSIEQLTRKAEGGDAKAQELLGSRYCKGDGVAKNYKNGLRWYLEAAKHGEAEAQFNVGLCYELGRGVAENPIEAVNWYLMSARQGNAKAQNNLGVCCERGNGTEQSYQKAFLWYRKAARQGDEVAQCNLGNCYETGTGVEQNRKEAFSWYEKAAKRGDARGQYRLGKCYELGVGTETDRQKALGWYEKAAAQGNADGQAALKRLRQ
ncbi:MAG: serine/threonine-protein kinase [Prevotellaceae bacterium]|nr:serine/threonine-protein kinase [Prevotellaceae bacterium]